MSVFISWSQPRSREVAEALHRLIHQCLSPVAVWASSVDMEVGKKWFEEIEQHLGEARVGVVCITSKNLLSPWLHFEAGAMYKAVKLIPYLVDVGVSDLTGPLHPYQACTTTREGTMKLLRSVNESHDNIDEEVLNVRFDACWPEADYLINHTPLPITISRSTLGVTGIYLNRNEALDVFSKYLSDEIESNDPERPGLWIIGSSLYGFSDSPQGFLFWTAIQKAAATNCLRVLLTAPEISDLRELPENRARGQIKHEIGTSLQKLIKTSSVDKKYVRLCPIPPTVSAIATN